MKHYRRNTLAMVLAMGLLSGGGCLIINTNNPPANHWETRTLTAPAAAGIDVKGGNGAVVVHRAAPASPTTAPASQISITARVAATTPERLSATRILTELQPDGTLVVRADWPGGRALSNESCGFDITVPGEMRSVRCHTSNGEIRMIQLAGDAQLGTSTGRFVVEDHAGAVRASTSNGAVTMKRISGTVEARTSNGAVELSEVGGGVVAQTSNGRVNVALGAQAAGPLDVRTSNGPISITLPATYAGRFSITTSNGTIRFPSGPNVRDFATSRNHASFTMGDGTATSTIATSNGGVDLKIAP